MNALLDSLASLRMAGDWRAFAFDVVWRTTLVLGIALLFCAMWRRSSASWRHLVWTSAVLGTLLTPLLMLALPSWRLAVLPSPSPSNSPGLAQAKPLAHPPLILSADRLEAPSSARSQSPVAWSPMPDQVRANLAPAPSSFASSSVLVSPKAYARFWAVGISAGWGIGAALVAVWLLAGRVRLQRLKRRLTRLEAGAWVDEADRLRSRLRIRRRVALLRGDDAISPMTWGVLRPAILMPRAAESWPDDRVRAVLLHELAHVRRCDDFTQILAQLACALYWFNPLVWIAARRLVVERERACDDLVLQTGSRATDYAGHLLDVAKTLRSASPLVMAGVPMARPSQIESRLRAILDGSRNHRAVSKRGAGLLLAAAAILLLPLAAARLDALPVADDPVRTNGENEVANPQQKMIITGRVLDSDGRPAAGAQVAAVGRRKLAALNARAEDQQETLGNTVADAEGQFRLEARRTSSVTHYEAHVLAGAPGFGLGWTEFNRDSESPTVDVKLRPEQIVEGRLVDLQGAPASGVEARVLSVGVPKKEVGRFDGLNFWKELPEGMEAVWPKTIKTDEDGRFQIAGIGRGVQASLRVNDPRFAMQIVGFATDAEEGPKRVVLPLQPGMKVAGRVVCSDTGEPLRDAIVMVGASMNAYGSGGEGEYRTDADGRYEANPTLGKYLHVTVYPPVGSPYLIFQRNFKDNEGTLNRTVDLAVPRGVLISGRVAEGGGRSLAGASVYYDNGEGNVVDAEGTIPGWMAAVSSGPDGHYAIAVTPGKGHLVVYGPTSDYVHEMKGNRELDSGKPGGRRLYAHRFIAYEAKADGDDLKIDADLRPGTVIVGRVEGPDGQTVDQAEIITTLSISPFHTFWRGDFTVPVRDGRFELHGVPRDRAVKCSFLDAKNGWGATIDVTGAQADAGPLVVKLAPCGTAKARIVDEQGKPVAKSVVNLNIVANPGRGTNFGAEPLTEAERAMLDADEEIYANVDRRNYWEAPRSDAEGRITLPYLVPGATYRIYEYTPEQGKDVHRWRDFVLEPGQTLDLGDVRVKSQGN